MPVKILLADKSITIQKVVEMLFSGRDYEVTSVSDGESALKEASRAVPDVVLADVDLPKVDGYAFSARLKQTPQLAKIPVILMMSRDDAYDIAKGKEAGIIDNIAKPFESQELIAKVKKAVAPAPPRPSEPVRPAPEQKPAVQASLRPAEPVRPAPEQRPTTPISRPTAAPPPPPQPPASAAPKQDAPADIFDIIQEAPTASEVRQAAGLPVGEQETIYEVEPEVEEVEEPMPREVTKALPVGEKAVEEMRAGLGLQKGAGEEQIEAESFETFEGVMEETEPEVVAPKPAPEPMAARTVTAPVMSAAPPPSEGEIRKMVEDAVAKLAKERFEAVPPPPAVSESDLRTIAEEAVAKLAKERFEAMQPPQPAAISESDLWIIAEEAVSRMAKEAFAQMPSFQTVQPSALPESEVRRMAEEAVLRMAEDAFREMPPPPLPKISEETIRRGIEDAVMKVAREIAKEVIERVAWDVIPPLAEQMIREEIERLKAEP